MYIHVCIYIFETQIDIHVTITYFCQYMTKFYGNRDVKIHQTLKCGM